MSHRTARCRRDCIDGGGLSSRFVFAGARIYGGVAHALTVQAQLAGAQLRASEPVWIEVREP